MSVGSILKFQRQQYGISQNQLAETLHVSRQSISSWENDRSYPSLDNLIALSDLYKLSIDDLLKDNDELREKIIRNQKRIEQYEEQLERLNDIVESQKEPDLDQYEKNEELMFIMTLIFIAIALLPIGPIIPISYMIVKKREKKKKDAELNEKENQI